jgi:type II secretory pathway pseudopilin PulG
MKTEARSSESGFTLAGLLIILTVMGVVLAFSVPRMWSDILKRERELQTIWVMKQYARAINEFQQKRGSPPVNLEQLKEQTTPRVLRQLYPNPLSGKMDWILVPAGTQTPAQAMVVVNPNQPNQPRPVVPQAPPQNTGLTGPQGNVPFIGVRPPTTGDSYITLYGAEQYENWMYTVNELEMERTQKLGGAPGAPGQPGTPGAPPRPTPTRRP